MARAFSIGEQAVVKTPDAELNAGVAAACHAIDGAYYPPVYVHGGMLWNVPFPGWRTLYGPTAFGWHENVKAQARYYLASQEREARYTEARAESSLGLGQQSSKSRFYGRGRITRDNHFYNFQSQFFDMLIYAWRATADRELESLLRPALEMQLEWARDCFDPDGDGLYESYNNTWPTDSVWYAGGGSAEETAYAFRGHEAAGEMARRAGDDEFAAAHVARVAKIRRALLEQLWVGSKGHPGVYREQGGLRRIHEDAWLYSVFCPIDSRMLPPFEAAQALHYTEWGLERVYPATGGQRCWTSNWVPSTWSTRELYNGDNYHLALAYWQTGFAEPAWNLFRGNFVPQMYCSIVPGDAGAPNGGTDFNDCSSMFARTVVEGLFGYRPDYPNETVYLNPGFPEAWQEASIRTPDFSLAMKKTDNAAVFQIRLARPAKIVFGQPVRTRRVTLEIDGRQPATFESEPGLDAPVVKAVTPRTDRSTITLRRSGPLPEIRSAAITSNVGDAVRLSAPEGGIVRFADPQGVLADARLADGAIVGRLAADAGRHMLFGLVDLPPMSYWHVFRLDIADPNTDAARAKQNVRRPRPGARFECIDIRPLRNGDIRAIYQQQYLSPWPNTCSVRIGTDGYSPWTFHYWNIKPPLIDLTNVPKLLEAAGRLVAAPSVPFAWHSEERNIAFTSTWDNWPKQVKTPVGKTGEAVWFLLCGTTNPMQTRIANAVLRLKYADGATDTLELTPPENFWTLCPLGAADYNYDRDRFALPKQPPLTVQLGNNCRAILVGRALRAGVRLDEAELETLSPEVVVGLMGVTVEMPP